MKRSALETLYEMLSRDSEALEKFPQISRAIATVVLAVERSEDAASLAVLAYNAGFEAGGATIALKLKRPLLNGIASIEGGKQAAERIHGTPAERAAKITRARELYKVHSAKQLQLSRKVLCGMVAEEMQVKPATIAQWVPNPTQTRRGRPRKH